MAKKGIREYHAKKMLARGLFKFSNGKFNIGDERILITPDTDLSGLETKYPWLGKKRLVVKPDQLFGKRGKNNLLLIDADIGGAKKWIAERMEKETTIVQTTGTTTGTLTHFLLEPFTPHTQEYYVAIVQEEDGDVIHFSTSGGVDIESVWDTVSSVKVPVLGTLSTGDIEKGIPDIPDRDLVIDFIRCLYEVFDSYYFTYLELNPFTVVNDNIEIMDTVAKLDDTANYQCAEKWGKIEFPKSFGGLKMAEEEYIAQLDERTGASLKLTILNPEGRVWNLVAGGGASVIYADTAVDLGFADELANYGEYSGNPSQELTYEYTRTILELMTRQKNLDGKPKYLIIGGGIANFTDVAKTFTGIIQAIESFSERMKEVDVRIFVRRGGPNYKEGLENMRQMGSRLGLPIEVYGPETHMTRIVSLALKGGD